MEITVNKYKLLCAHNNTDKGDSCNIGATGLFSTNLLRVMKTKHINDILNY